MKYFRTPDERFENLEDYPFQPNYQMVEYRKNKRPIRGHSTLSARSTAMPQSC